MDKEQKNKQLKLIKEHFAWLIIISVTIILIVVAVTYVGWRLYNAQKFHIKTDKRFENLEKLHE